MKYRIYGHQKELHERGQHKKDIGKFKETQVLPEVFGLRLMIRIKKLIFIIEISNFNVKKSKTWKIDP